MPDHVHLIATPFETISISALLQRMKSVSSHGTNHLLRRRGRLWQDESFDRILRSTEDVRRKAEYIVNNPIRAGLVSQLCEYRWIWREWVEGQARAPVLHR